MPAERSVAGISRSWLKRMQRSWRRDEGERESKSSVILFRSAKIAIMLGESRGSFVRRFSERLSLTAGPRTSVRLGILQM